MQPASTVVAADQRRRHAICESGASGFGALPAPPARRFRQAGRSSARTGAAARPCASRAGYRSPGCRFRQPNGCGSDGSGRTCNRATWVRSPAPRRWQPVRAARPRAARPGADPAAGQHHRDRRHAARPGRARTRRRCPGGAARGPAPGAAPSAIAAGQLASRSSRPAITPVAARASTVGRSTGPSALPRTGTGQGSAAPPRPARTRRWPDRPLHRRRPPDPGRRASPATRSRPGRRTPAGPRRGRPAWRARPR